MKIYRSDFIAAKINYVLGGAFALVLCSEQAFAAGFRLPNQSAYATARGNAFVATADNPSAVYYNPAGLTQITEPSAEVGVYAINFAVDAERPAGQFANEDKIQLVPQAYYANGNGEWSWGLGLYAPFGLGNDWPDNTDFTSITTSAQITYLTASPVVSKEIAPGLSIGLGLTFNYADSELEQGIGLVPGDRFRFEGDDFGVGFVGGLLWQIDARQRFGVTYRSGVSHDLSGTSNVSFVPQSRGSELDIDIPALVSVGYAYQFSETLDVEFNIEWGDWSVLDQVIVSNSPLAGTDIPINFAWEDGYIYQLGMTKVFGNYALSFGYDYNESVQTDEFYNPAVADADRHWLNLGISSLANNPWTLTYQYGFSDRTVTGATVNPMTLESGNGYYEVRAHSLSFSYQF